MAWESLREGMWTDWPKDEWAAHYRLFGLLFGRGIAIREQSCLSGGSPAAGKRQ